VAAVIGVRNALAVVTPALLPGAVLGRKILSTMLLPVATLFALLCIPLLL